MSNEAMRNRLGGYILLYLGSLKSTLTDTGFVTLWDSVAGYRWLRILYRRSNTHTPGNVWPIPRETGKTDFPVLGIQACIQPYSKQLRYSAVLHEVRKVLSTSDKENCSKWSNNVA
jgi:hypothetical protein